LFFFSRAKIVLAFAISDKSTIAFNALLNARYELVTSSLAFVAYALA